MKNDCDGLISRLDVAEERIFELENMSIDSSKMEIQRERWLKIMEQNIQELRDAYKKCTIHKMGISEEEKQKKYMKQ